MEVLIGIGYFIGAVVVVGAGGLFCIKGAKRLIDELNAEIDRRYY